MSYDNTVVDDNEVETNILDIDISDIVDEVEKKEDEAELQKNVIQYDPHGLVQAIIEYRNGTRNVDSLANVAYPVIKRVSGMVSRRAGIDENDLAQELWFTFKKVIVDSYELDKKIIPYIYGCALRVAKSIRDKVNGREVLLGEDGHAAIEAAEYTTNEKHSSELEQDLDRKKALEKISQAMYDNNVTLTSKETVMAEKLEFDINKEGLGMAKGGDETFDAVPPVVLPQAEKLKRPLTPQQREIVESRQSLNMTQDQFATELDINPYSLSSYEYGRANPQPALLNKVRMLMQGGNPRLSEVKILKKAYEKPMSEILRKWSIDYRLDFDNDQQLAEAMDTTSATIHRWKNDDVKPSVDSIEAYRKAIERGARKMHYAVKNFMIHKETGVLVRL